jgi:hypothetical protein
MSDIKARYVGHPDGVDLLQVPVGTEGEFRRWRVVHGGELPTEIDGMRVPAAYRDSLLEQADWTEVRRESKTETPAKADTKEAGS